jgi:hypothetical protein
MNKIILTSLLAAFTFGSLATAEAKSKKHYRYDDDDREYYDKKWNKHGYRDRSRTIYVIERNRPVRRVVYVSPGGGYYRIVDGRRRYVSGRYYTSYPSRYYYSDGRPRVGVSVSF